ncbi:MAG: beta-hydroxyacyl-ACP dehydratase [Planctomycetota bacterium]|nr:beta-hydroxyacyl-ACP dehydratase [Planctomycetota bacterium]
MRFRLIDQVVEREDSRIVTVKAVTLAEEYLADHFPSFPVLPGVFMLEAMVQSARLLIPDTRRRFVLGGVKAMRYGNFVGPGELLRTEVELKKYEDDVATFRCEGTVVVPGGDVAGSDTAVSGRFTMRPTRTARIAVGARRENQAST